MTDNFSGLSNSPNYGDLVKHVNLKYVLSEKINNNLWRQTNHFKHRRSQYEANRGTRLGKILPNTVDFYFFYQTDNIRRFHTADFLQRTVCSPRL